MQQICARSIALLLLDALMALTMAIMVSGLWVPIEIRPHVCSALAADAADESLLDIGQPESSGQCRR
jgi:hypothetical protein